MRCKDYGVTQVMVGLQRVGIVGLRDALDAVEHAGLEDREVLVDRLVELLSTQNFVPSASSRDYRAALWREYVRHTGGDIRPLFTEVEVVVRGGPGDRRDRMVEMADEVFAKFELVAKIRFEVARFDTDLELAIGEHVVVAGLPGRDQFETAVRRSFSEW